MSSRECGIFQTTVEIKSFSKAEIPTSPKLQQSFKFWESQFFGCIAEKLWELSYVRCQLSNAASKSTHHRNLCKSSTHWKTTTTTSCSTQKLSFCTQIWRHPPFPHPGELDNVWTKLLTDETCSLPFCPRPLEFAPPPPTNRNNPSQGVNKGAYLRGSHAPVNKTMSGKFLADKFTQPVFLDLIPTNLTPPNPNPRLENNKPSQ